MDNDAYLVELMLIFYSFTVFYDIPYRIGSVFCFVYVFSILSCAYYLGQKLWALFRYNAYECEVLYNVIFYKFGIRVQC